MGNQGKKSTFLTKMLFNELFIWALWGQNVGPGWVKNGKSCFPTLNTKFLKAIVS